MKPPNDSLIIIIGLCKFHLFLAINKALPEDREDYFNNIDNVIKTCKVEIEDVFQKGSSENGLEKDRNKFNKMVQDGIRNIAKHISESKGLGKKIKHMYNIDKQTSGLMIFPFFSKIRTREPGPVLGNLHLNRSLVGDPYSGT